MTTSAKIRVYGLTDQGRATAIREVRQTNSVHNVPVNRVATLGNMQSGSNVFGLEKTNKTTQSHGRPVSRDAGRATPNLSMLATLHAVGMTEAVQ